MASMDAKTKQKTLRLISNGMYVLASRSAGQFGVATVTWVTQASFKPPLIVAAVRMDSNVFRCLSESRYAVLHILGSDQIKIAQKFFSPTRGSDGELNGEPFFEGKTGAPILENLPAYVECKVVDICEKYGDHAIVIFEAVEVAYREGIEPLTIAGSPWEYGG